MTYFNQDCAIMLCPVSGLESFVISQAADKLLREKLDVPEPYVRLIQGALLVLLGVVGDGRRSQKHLQTCVLASLPYFYQALLTAQAADAAARLPVGAMRPATSR